MPTLTYSQIASVANALGKTPQEVQTQVGHADSTDQEKKEMAATIVALALLLLNCYANSAPAGGAG